MTLKGADSTAPQSTTSDWVEPGSATPTSASPSATSGPSTPTPHGSTTNASAKTDTEPPGSNPDASIDDLSIDQLAATQRATAPLPRLSRPAYFADRHEERTRRREDLTDVILALLGIALVWVLGMYAHSTTQGVTDDVRNVFAGALRAIFLLPVTLIEGLIILAGPIVIVGALARRGRLTTIIETLLTAAIATFTGWVLMIVLDHVPADFTAPLGATGTFGAHAAINLVLMTLAALFTTAGETTHMRSIRYGWLGLAVVAFFGVIRGTMSLPSALVSLLLGRMIGSLARWVLGFEDQRATGIDIVEGLLSIGIVPSRIIRSDLETSTSPLVTWKIDEVDSRRVNPDRHPTGDGSASVISGADMQPGRDTALVGARPGSTAVQAGSETTNAGTPETDVTDEVTTSTDEEADVTSTRQDLHMFTTDVDLVEYTVTRYPQRPDARHYAVWDDHGRLWEVQVLDPGRELTGTLIDVWNNLRLRGISRWVSPSLKANAERSTLTTLAAHRAGVHVAEPLGMAQVGDSILVASKAIPPVTTLKDSPDHLLSDDVLDQVWNQLLLAHSRSITHRDLTFDSVMLDASGQVWLLGWDQGEVATNELNRRIDIAQMLVLLSVCVGEKRALESAVRAVGIRELKASAPVLQGAVLPAQISRAVRKSETLANLRTAIVGDEKNESAQLLKLERFAPKTIITVAILAVALIVVLGSMNFREIADAVTSASPVWILIAFILGALTWFGAAVPLVALSTEKIKLSDATLAQIAASVVTVVAPAGIGPAALNLRFLNKQKVETPMAITTVTLMQISQFLTTVALLFIILLTGASSTPLNISLPTSTIVLIVVAVLAVVATALAVPKLRRWLWEKIKPTWKQIYPRLIWIVGQPKRIAAVLGGNIVMNIGFVGAFWAALKAFGGELNLLTLAVTYLASNSLGSVIPSPGGIGPVEAALTGGLQVAGIPVSVALSTAVLYRLVTFYGRIPFGWAALKIMQKKDLL